MDTREPYPSDLTPPEWAQVCRFIPAPKPGGRPAKYDRKEIADALLYVARIGCRWRALPHDLPPWTVVDWYFRCWSSTGCTTSCGATCGPPRGGAGSPRRRSSTAGR